jgi:hypothetical protein
LWHARVYWWCTKRFWQGGQWWLGWRKWWKHLIQNSIQDHILNILILLFTHLPSGRDNKFYSPVYQFLILFLVKENRKWLAGHQITQLFVALLFCGQEVMMVLMHHKLIQHGDLCYSEWVSECKPRQGFHMNYNLAHTAWSCLFLTTCERDQYHQYTWSCDIWITSLQLKRGHFTLQLLTLVGTISSSKGKSSIYSKFNISWKQLYLRSRSYCKLTYSSDWISLI